MSKIEVKAHGNVRALPEQVYAIIADYRAHHPFILPKPYFASLEVEAGGIGEGTVFRTSLEVMGRKFDYRMRVSEKQNAKVITESDLNTDLVTSFTIEPEGPNGSRVTIASVWTPQRGFKGLLERWFTPGVMKKIYRAELKKLDEYAQRF